MTIWYVYDYMYMYMYVYVCVCMCMCICKCILCICIMNMCMYVCICMWWGGPYHGGGGVGGPGTCNAHPYIQYIFKYMCIYIYNTYYHIFIWINAARKSNMEQKSKCRCCPFSTAFFRFLFGFRECTVIEISPSPRYIQPKPVSSTGTPWIQLPCQWPPRWKLRPCCPFSGKGWPSFWANSLNQKTKLVEPSVVPKFTTVIFESEPKMSSTWKMTKDSEISWCIISDSEQLCKDPNFYIPLWQYISTSTSFPKSQPTLDGSSSHYFQVSWNTVHVLRLAGLIISTISCGILCSSNFSYLLCYLS